MPEVIRYLGVGLEDDFGVEVPADFHVDGESATLDSPSDTEMYYGGGLGRGDRTRRPGYYSPSGNVVYGWDVRTITHMLYLALGGYTFTVDTPEVGQNTHEVYALDDRILPSATLRLGKDVFEHVFRGCVADSLELGLTEDFLRSTLNVNAVADAKAAVEDVGSLLLPDEFPLAFHELTFELPQATDLSADVRSLSLSIANQLQGDAGRGVGSRFPNRLPVAARAVTLGLDLWFEDTTQKESFWGGASGPAPEGAADYAVRIVADAGDDGRLQLDIGSAHFTQVNTQWSGRDEIVQSTQIKAMVAPHGLLDGVTNVDTEILATAENVAADLTA